MPEPPETAAMGRTPTAAATSAASEVTPLLRPEAAADGAGSRRGSSASSDTYRDSGSSPDDDHDGKAKQEVTPRRAVAICLSVFVLIFLQGR